MAKLKHLELPNGSNYDIYGVNVQEISYDDYQALTPTQKNSDIAYCITDTPYEVDDSIYGEASGAIASFNNGSANPLKSLEVDINPIQDLHGYSKPWAAGAGKNKLQVTATSQTLNGVTFTVNDDGTVLVNGTASGIAIFTINNISNLGLIDGTQYILSGCSGGSSSTYKLDILKDNGSPEVINYNGDTAFTKEAILNKEIRIVVYSGVTVSNIVFKPMIRLATETDATFAPYTNICPISGRSSVGVTVEGKNLLDGLQFAENIRDYGYNAILNTTDKYVRYTRGIINPDTGQYIQTLFESNFKTNVQYTVIFSYSNAGNNTSILLEYTDETRQQITLANSSNQKQVYAQTTSANKTLKRIVLSFYGDATTDLYYEESGLFEGVLTAQDFEPYAATTETISLGQTIYGGKLNVTTGELTVDRLMITTNENTPWTGGSATNKYRWNYVWGSTNLSKPYNVDGDKRVSSMFKQDSTVYFDSASNVGFTTNNNALFVRFNDSAYNTQAAVQSALNGATFVYPLATPTTATLTPTEVDSLLGNNNIWADSGDVDLMYITSDFIYNELRMNDTVIASNSFAYHSIESESATMAGHANTASNAQTVNGHTVNSDVPSNATFTDTTYTFANGTNGFTVTPSGGTAQTVTVTPSISNNVTGSGTSGYLAKFNGANTITNGAQLGSDTTKFLRNDGTWAVPPGAGGGVTGVKGNAESTYRTGNVNLTPANLGLESKPAASGGLDLSLVTTGEKAVWNGKPSTDTKNTAGSTDTSSQIYLIGATSQAANPQTYSQDTAYVGTDGCLYSGGTKVEVVSNNAGYHNSIYRGKSLGTSITTAQWNAISAGTFDDMYIGDYWTLSTTIGSTTSNIQYVIAGFDYWWNCGDSYPQSSNKHHVVLVPVGYLYLAHMNATNITTGGYIGSAMYTTNLEIARTGISTLFGNHLYSVRRLFTNSVNTVGQATGWAWATSSVDLMSETMVYGHPVWTTSGFEVGVDRTILPLFALNPASASISSNWWLRSVATPSYFARVNSSGNAACDNASLSNGVRPAFAIY